jgi:predicted metalloprotease with PDZ domain
MKQFDLFRRQTRMKPLTVRPLARSVLAFAFVASAGAFAPAASPHPSIAYSIRLDSLHLDVADVAITFKNAPASFHLAMKVHAEYDGKYWRHLDGFRVDGRTGAGAANIARQDTTLWRVTLPGGDGVVRYRVHIQPPPSAIRGAWRPHSRPDGALINGPDFFLYPVEFSDAPVTLDLDVPHSWRVATALASRGGAPTNRSAPDAATLLDSPILLGALHQWSFTDRGTTFHVVYWPLPNATPFDSLAFVDAMRRLASATLDVFGRAPANEFYFLFQDGANDALEHRASVTVGVQSARLAQNPRAPFVQIAHEFFHSWNLVAIRPAGYNDLSYRAPARTSGLWMGEGVTLHYADVLLRRAGLDDTTQSRLDHVASLVERYYGSPGVMRVAPERVSLAFGDSPFTNPDAVGSYYLQGELLGDVIDGLVRDSTHERRGLDDVMRALFARSRTRSDSGFTSRSLEHLMDSVCDCRLDALFTNQIRGAGPIDVTPVLSRLGLRLQLDSVPVVDSIGRAAPDCRLGVYFGDEGPNHAARLVLSNPATPWWIAGVRTGDELRALNGVKIATHEEMQNALRGVRVGDRVRVDVDRDTRSMSFDVPITGYVRPRVRFVDAESVSAEQRARRQAWMAGR